MGNGPSIKLQFENIKKSRNNFELLCVNNFPNTKYYTELKPNYFLISSYEYWNNENTVDQNKQIRYDVIRALIQKTDWPIIFFLPAKSKSTKKFISNIRSNKNIEIQFFNTTPVSGFINITHWCFKMNLGMPRPHNVLIPSIMIAINSGFENIMLFGADHSWLPEISVDDKNNALISQKHFYKSPIDQKGFMYQNGPKPRKLHEILYKFMLSFKAYHILEQYAKKRKINIHNYTEGSFIDAFTRKKPSDLW